MIISLELWLLIFLFVPILLFVLLGLTEGREYLTSAPRVGDEYITSIMHSEEITLTLAGLVMTALTLFISVRYGNLESITPILLFFSISFSTLVLSSALMHFRTKRLFSYISDVLSNTGLLAFGCGFLIFFLETFQWSSSLTLVFIAFVSSYFVLCLYHLQKYHRYWAVLKTRTRNANSKKSCKSVKKGTLVILVSISLVMLFAGLYFYQVTFSKHEISSQVSTGIIVGQHPYHFWEISNFEIELNPSEKRIFLLFHFSYEQADNYSIAITLPYRIASVSPSGEEDWVWKNATSGSVIMVTINAIQKSGSQMVDTTLNLADPIEQTVFDVYGINLPFGGSFTLDVQEEWNSLKSIAPISPVGNGLNGSLRLVVPSSAVMTTCTHQMTRRDPTRKEFQIWEFQIEGFKPFFIQYLLPNERYSFQWNIFLSGILIGAGVSGLMSSLTYVLEKT